MTADAASSTDDKPKDLSSIHSRSYLVAMGLKHLEAGEPENAMLHFGAAIRRATRENYTDVEVEYYRYVALFKRGDFPAALQRCANCLDSLDTVVKEKRDKNIAYAAVLKHIERTLLSVMVLSGVGFFGLRSHLASTRAGISYKLKRPRSFIDSSVLAWDATKNLVPPTVDDLRHLLGQITRTVLEGKTE